jgi:hypothetical protein
MSICSIPDAQVSGSSRLTDRGVNSALSTPQYIDEHPHDSANRRAFEKGRLMTQRLDEFLTVAEIATILKLNQGFLDCDL